MRVRISLLLIIACLMGAPVPSWASQDSSFPQQKSAENQTLFLDLSINGVEQNLVVRIIKDGNTLYTTKQDMDKAGIKCAGWPRTQRGLLILSDVKNLHADIDMKAQTIDLKLGNAELMPSVIQVRQNKAAIPSTASSTGAYLNYNMVGTHMSDVNQLAGTFGVTGFSSYGNVTSQFEVNLQNASPNYAANIMQPDFSRLNSYYQYNWPQIPRSLIVGDFLTDSLSWTRAELMGGIQVETNYDLQPGTITFPTPQINGGLPVASTVNLLVNNMSAYQSNERAGPYSMVDIPVINGANSITIQTRNPNGTISSTTVPFYVSTDMLRAGLSTYALNIGWLRHNYGVYGDTYAILAGSGSYRYGINDHLTLNTHAEVAGNVQMGGIGLTESSDLGEFNEVAAISNENGHQALLGGLSWSRTASIFSAAAGITYAQPGFADLGTDLNVPYPRQNLYASGSVAIPRNLGSFSIAYTDQTSYLNQGFYPNSSINPYNANNITEKFLVGSYNVTTKFGLTIALSLFDGLTSSSGSQSANRGINISLSLPFGRNIQASSNIQTAQSQLPELQEQVAKLADPDGGYGWSVSNSTGAYSSQSVSGEILTNSGNLYANAQNYNGQTQEQINAAGSFVLLDGLHISSPTYQSFTVVDVGYPHVPVYRENRYYGDTRSNGTILVPNLEPYTRNIISIDATKLPITAAIKNEDIDIVPPLSGGAVAKFDIQKFDYAVLSIKLPQGGAPAPGSILEIAGQRPQVIGYDGEVEVEKPPSHLSGKVLMRSSSCQFEKAIPKNTIKPFRTIDVLCN